MEPSNSSQHESCINPAPGLTLWRYPCGFVYGLAAAGVLIACTIPFVDGLLMSHMEYNTNDQLHDAPALLGWTIPELLQLTWVCLLIGLPLFGIVVQHKPIAPALNSGRALMAGTVFAVFSIGMTIELIRSNIFYWAYLYI